MPLLQGAAETSIIASLFTQALRQGQSLWFRVASGSMQPTFSVGDQIYIEPAMAHSLRPGEIVAFETSDSLVVHRVVRRKPSGTHILLLEMSDAYLQANWIEEQAVVGRVVAIRRGRQQADLQRPVAKRCGAVTAYLRFRLYQVHANHKFTSFILSKCSRLVVRICSWCVRLCCSSSIPDVPGLDN